MNIPSRDIVSAVFPETEIREGLDEYGSLMSIEKARRLIGFNPEFSWRDN